ncbi:hypothetical protein ACERK3_02230 [Phycisphaerales bacterium AB-hyl4]|uniref:Uncharacterized protein n=1 Tax=Natronomicrosphaera hydrolytica TaxID=3242702 RepID=A0ABV4U0G8_9BACT
MTGDPVNVAKPPELRHDAAYYEDVDSVSTTDAQTVEVAISGEDDETWVTKPPYITGGGGKHASEILATRTPMARRVEVEEGEEQVPLRWMDTNTTGRVWGLEEDDD